MVPPFWLENSAQRVSGEGLAPFGRRLSERRGQNVGKIASGDRLRYEFSAPVVRLRPDEI